MTHRRVSVAELERLAFDHNGHIERDIAEERAYLTVGRVTYVADLPMEVTG